MSNIYITEPPTNGKVLLKTSLGDIDVELWSKESPLACRNFVQLCLEGYYDETIFHRIISDFAAQGGDPTGTGEGGESIYGKPFKDEFHQRLKFTRRGLVAMVNGGPNDNGSQFFFTLGRADELNQKNTIFGKVTGNTLYNLIKFNEISTDTSDRPFEPPKVFRTEILNNPFNDIVPREQRRKTEKRKNEKLKSQSKATKNFGLLSFGEQAEEDEEEMTFYPKIKSSHDVLTTDPKLTSEPVISQDELRQSRKRKHDEDISIEEKRIHQEGEVEEEKEEISKMDSLKLLSKQLKKELRDAKRQKEKEEAMKKQKKEEIPDVVKELIIERERYSMKSKSRPRKKGEREKSTLEMLSKFKSRLAAMRTHQDEEEEKEEVKEEKVEEDQEESETTNWLTHQVTFESERLAQAKDAMMTQTEDYYDIYDPRNPLNIRRREQNKPNKINDH